MSERIPLAPGDRVSVFLDASRWRTAGWVQGTIIRIDGYSAHRSFHWIELDLPAEPFQGGAMSVISVLNPKHIRPE
jgi:hypothetical protein